MAQPLSNDGLKLIPHWREEYYFDGTPSPDHLDDWRDAWAAYLTRYGDVVRALNIWNEPWEGGGISNWRSSGEYYRQLFLKAKEARDAVDPSVKLVAADSADNTAWKLIAAGMADDLDVISIHYETPSTTTAWALGDHYDIEVWDTETWLAHLGDASIARMAVHEFLLGATKVSLWTETMLLDSKRKNPTPSVPGIAALAHLLNGKDEVSLVHPERPPTVVLFKGNDGKQQVAMVSTTLSDYIARIPGTKWAQQAPHPVTMQLELAEADWDRFAVLDVYANPTDVEIVDGKHQIPVDMDVRFLRFDGPAEVIERALAEATVVGGLPVEIALEDIRLATDTTQGEFSVRLTNVHPFEVTGQLAVEASWPLASGKPQDFTLAANEERSLQVELDLGGVDLIKSNACEVSVEVTSDHGSASLRERLRVAMIGRGTPAVDGDLSDWAELGAIPVELHSSDAKAAASDLYDPQKPWETRNADADGMSARVAFSSDEDFLYIMAEVLQAGPKDVLPSLLTDEPLHEFQNPPMDHVYIKPGPRPPWIAPKLQLALGPVDRTEQIKGFEAFAPTDPMYPYGLTISALHQIALYPIVGGGAEALRMRRGDFSFLHPVPVDYAWMKEHSSIDNVQVEVRVTDAGYTYEAAIPWAELDTVTHAPGDEIYLSFVLQGQDKKGLDWSFRRSQTGLSPSDWGNMNGKPTWGARTKWWFQ